MTKNKKLLHYHNKSQVRIALSILIHLLIVHNWYVLTRSVINFNLHYIPIRWCHNKRKENILNIADMTT